MPYAITLVLDAEAASSVVAMWETLASRGLSDDALRLGYPPHLTLAVFPDNADLTRLLAAVRDGAARWRELPIALTSLGLFPGMPAAMFLAPVVTPELLALHTGFLTSLPGEMVDPHYQIGHWVPHVTLAEDLTDPAAAISVLAPQRFPMAAMLDTVELVRFRPVQVLASHRLAAG